jgi:hypothetical protein
MIGKEGSSLRENIPMMSRLRSIHHWSDPNQHASRALLLVGKQQMTQTEMAKSQGEGRWSVVGLIIVSDIA